MVILLIGSKHLISISYYFCWRDNGWNSAAQTRHLVHPRSLIITHTSGLSPTHQHTCSHPCAGLVPQQHSPMLQGTHGRGTWALPRQEEVCRTGPRERTAHCEGPRWPQPCSLAWRLGGSGLPKGPGVGRGARGRLPVGQGDPSHLHYPIPAILKCSHQIGHR